MATLNNLSSKSVHCMKVSFLLVIEYCYHFSGEFPVGSYSPYTYLLLSSHAFCLYIFSPLFLQFNFKLAIMYTFVLSTFEGLLFESYIISLFLKKVWVTINKFILQIETTDNGSPHNEVIEFKHWNFLFTFKFEGFRHLRFPFEKYVR